MTSSVAEEGRGGGQTGDRPGLGQGQPDVPHVASGAGTFSGVPGQAPPYGRSTPRPQAPAGGEGARPLPPGQHIAPVWPVMHYGPVPTFRPERWDLRVCGATASGADYRWDWTGLSALPRARVTADMHCVTKFTATDLKWEGVAAAELLRLAPPAPHVTHVMVWADYGYSANLPITDFADERTLFASYQGGAELTPEHGYPVRLVVPHRFAWKSVKWVRAIEYLLADRRGFWEERGYHNTADPWREQRFSYQEMAGEGPPL